ncbi:MAG TPA: response regulator [Candidatus Limnocylindria bacterium]|jgi:two-component system cell cycle response regulator DivK
MANELILIVEDNEKNLKLARDVLRFHGYRTVEATDGESAIAMSLEHLPALILMDIQLPGIDGIVAMKRIRADERTKHIPTVALTASVMSGDRERFDSAGFDGFIAKPIEVKNFPGQVRAYLDAKQ